MRSILFRVEFRDPEDKMVTLYEDTKFEAAEFFAKNYNGGESEVFIRKVYKLVNAERKE